MRKDPVITPGVLPVAILVFHNGLLRRAMPGGSK
jgi:hypothetical protein